MLHEHPGDHGKQACYYFNYPTVDGVDIFIRPVYKQVVVHTLNHFVEHKGIIIHAWCLMSNHLQMVAGPRDGFILAEIEKEFREFTTAKIIEALDTEPDARRKWLLDRFTSSGKIPGFTKKYCVWENVTPALAMDIRKSDSVVEQFEKIHDHPVRERIVDTPVEYKYSSARDYNGLNGLVQITKLSSVEQHLAAAENINGSIIVKYIRN